jgi:hypothetical protein
MRLSKAESTTLRGKGLFIIMVLLSVHVGVTFTVATIIGARGSASSLSDRLLCATIGLFMTGLAARGALMRVELAKDHVAVYTFIRRRRIPWNMVQGISVGRLGNIVIETSDGEIVQIHSPGPSRRPTRRWDALRAKHIQTISSAMEQAQTNGRNQPGGSA